MRVYKYLPLYLMSQFTDHDKHKPPDNINPSPLFKWAASILGSLTVLLVFDLYKTNNEALIEVSTGLNEIRTDVVEIRVKLDTLKWRLNNLPPNPSPRERS